MVSVEYFHSFIKGLTMIGLMFFGTHGSCRSQIAEGFARQWAPPDVKIINAGIDAQGLAEQAVRVMEEVNIDISNQSSHTFGQLPGVEESSIDIVITLAQAAARQCLLLPGAPVVVNWEISAPDRDADNPLEEYRRIRDEIAVKVKEFFTGGYFSTLLAVKRNNEIIIDHLSEGILAHNSRRIITCFNHAAEQITGYNRHEVIGRDCREVFPDGFCGGKCSFTAGIPDFDKKEYPLTIVTKDGLSRQVNMSVVSMRDKDGTFQGVLVGFRDITEVNRLRRKLKTVHSFHGIVGRDEKMQAIYELISDLAVSDCAVLVQGESGTGKELVAGAIHGESRRAGQPFVTINCGALPESILESELFGHVRGAFTGAVRDKKGRFELADGGTLFLDEVAELSANMQVKLLRVLQEGVFERVGDEKTIHVDVRVISATNKKLRKMVHRNEFREDLFYRLCVVPVDLPPLRERRNDIPTLISHFIKKFSKDLNRPIESISSAALNYMLDYAWPGNIRELQNAIQYAFVKCKDTIIQVDYLPPEIVSPKSGPVTGRPIRRRKIKAEQVHNALKQTRGNKSKAAEILGVGRSTLYRFLRNH